MKVIFATPSLVGPSPPYIAALEQSVALITAAGWEEGYAQEIGNAYISVARANMIRRALDAGADVIVCIDYDLGWKPKNLLELLETPGDVVAGTYRFKQRRVEYMGQAAIDDDGELVRRADGAILADRVPAGFLKLTRAAIHRFMHAYPHLMYGDGANPSVDLFNHGAYAGLWWGEDYAFCRNWRNAGGDIWLVPDLDIDHYLRGLDGSWKPFRGNFHRHLVKQQRKIA